MTSPSTPDRTSSPMHHCVSCVPRWASAQNRLGPRVPHSERSENGTGPSLSAPLGTLVLENQSRTRVCSVERLIPESERLSGVSSQMETHSPEMRRAGARGRHLARETFQAHVSHTDSGRTSRRARSRRSGWLMPDQHSGNSIVRDHHYRIRHLPLEEARTEVLQSGRLRY